MKKVLIVDDDRELVDIVNFALRRSGFEVLAAYDALTAMQHLRKSRPDLLVLDINLGSDDGFALLHKIRAETKLPIIILSGYVSEADKIRGLELGADDYLSKPFGFGELLARVRAHIRRMSVDWTPSDDGESQQQLRVGPFELNAAHHTVTKDGRHMGLTATEYRLLHYLMLNVGTVLSHQTIAKNVWGYDDPNAKAIVRVTMYRLRKKLETDPTNPALLQTVAGVGVVLNAERDGNGTHMYSK